MPFPIMQHREFTRTERFVLGKVAMRNVQGSAQAEFVGSLYEETATQLANGGWLIQDGGGYRLTEIAARHMMSWPRGMRPVTGRALQTYLETYSERMTELRRIDELAQKAEVN